MSELIKSACPFCGSKDIRFMGYPGMSQNAHCECKDCHTIGPAVFIDDEKAATEAWNRRAQPEANADAKDALLLRLRYYVDSKSQEYGYGFYRPGNPHDFTPDADQCSDDEIAAHKAACEAYDKGEYTHDHSGCIREGGMHILHAPWGIGSYIFRDPEVQELLDQIDAVRPSTPTTDAPQAKGSEVSK